MQDDAVGEDEIISDSQIARAVASGEIVPVMFGSALKMEGVEELLEVIGRYTEQAAYGSGFGAKVYRAQAAKDGEKLCFIKVTGGELKVKDTVEHKERRRRRQPRGQDKSDKALLGSKYILRTAWRGNDLRSDGTRNAPSRRRSVRKEPWRRFHQIRLWYIP